MARDAKDKYRLFWPRTRNVQQQNIIREYLGRTARRVFPLLLKRVTVSIRLVYSTRCAFLLIIDGTDAVYT